MDSQGYGRNIRKRLNTGWLLPSDGPDIAEMGACFNCRGNLFTARCLITDASSGSAIQIFGRRIIVFSVASRKELHGWSPALRNTGLDYSFTDQCLHMRKHAQYKFLFVASLILCMCLVLVRERRPTDISFR